MNLIDVEKQTRSLPMLSEKVGRGIATSLEIDQHRSMLNLVKDYERSLTNSYVIWFVGLNGILAFAVVFTWMNVGSQAAIPLGGMGSLIAYGIQCLIRR
ncbi:hypothetical protein GIW05_01295 [Pseudomonas syringae]|uniref:hypothetical protein n=1 Tax=Pseudomonas syringae TaxID=317 RepID=UPI001F30E4C5|nr:hypothetical protein [Pseudomonas syringae]MCF5382158.1 hypothetical protein [Pseudomonas syringae]MCF5423509.1 hypothetical protein [Pseudomonas syringae]MCF5455334.1 hypothetical protein [Pseudomonas syringae]MCF5460837.1 hypothetical protein [Pseudomonas syringae]